MCFAQEKAPRAEGRCAAFWSDDPRGGALFSFILVWPPTWEGTALLPTAMVFVSYGFVLVQVQVQHQAARCFGPAQTSRSPSLGPDRTTGMGPAHPQSPEELGNAS